MNNFIKYINDTISFNNTPKEFRKIVFYSEGKPYWSHFESIINCLLYNSGCNFCYVSSSQDDPGLSLESERVKTFLIGKGIARTIFFRTLKAGILIMTMPDFETFHIKRSVHPVHYVYIFHSMVSTHMIYRAEAFDHYDTVFCVGPHHVDEIRKREHIYSLKKKNLFEHGYGRLDDIISSNIANVTNGKNNYFNVLIAPSWGKHSIIESGTADKLISSLIHKNCKIILRPHPQTKINNIDSINLLNDKFSNFSNYTYDDDVNSQKALHTADIMISDWSGVALEFSFGLELPVLFLDLPEKTNNDTWKDLNITPLESTIRNEVGEILPINEIQNAAVLIETICLNSDKYIQAIRKTREKYIFNVGASGEIAAKELISLSNANMLDE